MDIGPTTIVRDIVLDRPEAAGLLERLGIDYCCGGSKPLADACARAGRDPEEVIAALRTSASTTASEISWADRPVSELITYIVDRHHGYLRSELPSVVLLGRKVVSRHGERHPELRDVLAAVEDLSSELELHLLKEERVLFPRIAELEQAGAAVAGMGGWVQHPIRVMIQEHEAAGEMLGDIRETSGGFELPEDACTSWRALYGSLQALERDLHEHIHLENNILFPKAIELERQADVAE